MLSVFTNLIKTQHINLLNIKHILTFLINNMGKPKEF